MKKFFIKIIIYALCCLVIGFFSFYMRVYDPQLKLALLKPKMPGYLIAKKEYLDAFTIGKQSINLVLGNSHTEHGIIPEMLGDNWFSYASDGQTIYNSYKFLEYYSDSVKIDTVITTLNPQDFAFSYLVNRGNDLPIFDRHFTYFESNILGIFMDSYSAIRVLINIRNNLSMGPREWSAFVKGILNYVLNANIPLSTPRYVSRQGYSGHNPMDADNSWNDLDSLYNLDGKGLKAFVFFRWSKRYFQNVNAFKLPHTISASQSNRVGFSLAKLKSRFSKTPSFRNFLLFHSFCQKHNIKVIYILTPKSKYYFKGLKREGNDVIWNNIKDVLSGYDLTIWDYESPPPIWDPHKLFLDETHLSYYGAQYLTKVIKNRLYLN